MGFLNLLKRGAHRAGTTLADHPTTFTAGAARGATLAGAGVGIGAAAFGTGAGAGFAIESARAPPGEGPASRLVGDGATTLLLIGGAALAAFALLRR